jgi:alkanesulfonate monooxygenase SsuD/methylene tetrahydromethanopterin reductase-like flavin-dependent oxidoreductase (luciferase family)
MVDIWGFYLFTTQDYSAGTDELTRDQCQDAFDNWTNLLAKTEGWGFDGVAFAEHHFMTTCLAPSPHLVISNLAARTQKLRFSTLGSVLALHHGWRYIEECAMLDFLTHGRFEPGIGPGSGSLEAVMAGIPQEEARPRYQSAANMFLAANGNPSLTFKDEFYNLENLGIVPRWQPESKKPVWVTVMSSDSAKWIAQQGWRICTGWIPMTLATKLADTYREALDTAGHRLDPAMVGIRRRAFVAESDAEAREKFEQAVDLMPFLVDGPNKGSKMEAGDERIRAMMSNPDDFAIGSPKTVADKLIAQCEEGGFGTLMAWADFASFRWADLAASHELFGAKVAPELRKANVGAGNQIAA